MAIPEDLTENSQERLPPSAVHLELLSENLKMYSDQGDNFSTGEILH